MSNSKIEFNSPFFYLIKKCSPTRRSSPRVQGRCEGGRWTKEEMRRNGRVTWPGGRQLKVIIKQLTIAINGDSQWTHARQVQSAAVAGGLATADWTDFAWISGTALYEANGVRWPGGWRSTESGLILINWCERKSGNSSFSIQKYFSLNWVEMNQKSFLR